MASDLESAKLLLPYLQRADEMQKHEPLVPDYCIFPISLSYLNPKLPLVVCVDWVIVPPSSLIFLVGCYGTFRLYAMEQGLNIPQSERIKTTNALLVSLMKQLEKG